MSAGRPLKRHLEPPTDEARIGRMWATVRARRERRRRVPARPALAVAALAAAAALALWIGAARETPAAPEGAASGALALADGSAPAAFESGARPRSFALADGSTIRLSPAARLETIQNDGARFATLLTRGSARFSVTPGGPRRWVVESGLATVEVIGTVFTVARSAEGVRVSVERGVVLVRGERVPDRVARLTRGERLFVPRRAGAPGEASAGPEPPEPRAVDGDRLVAHRAAGDEDAAGPGAAGQPTEAAAPPPRGALGGRRRVAAHAGSRRGARAATRGPTGRGHRATAGHGAPPRSPDSRGSAPGGGRRDVEGAAGGPGPGVDGRARRRLLEPTARRDGPAASPRRARDEETTSPDGRRGADASRGAQAGARSRAGRGGGPRDRRLLGRSGGGTGAGGDRVARWLARADDARRDGDLRTAVALLARVVRRGADRRAALAAFTLGRLEMDELRRPARARAAFSRALALGLPDRLAQQARRRLDEIGDEIGEVGDP